ncbi:MAG: single-stranded DNA-binding protein [Candidatus Taylorbacteria bacterium RIFCSPHIGHO2_02_FULL_46_13]|uniref:Single-stranded DNA-binding protein n=1 Tax=Candidatus Taylorbacteria bacterium RIFCSPHIGHO2_02_FULL_46_13 TaxID=1802312 RepID=A0A1G2MTW8_9BACT|nr:MAG: single-stranded DNA-binding protein [Candidatus Taylorbacteria bacterium RIFCSPHIGHO2_02_FULL_46_13]
MYLNKAIIIGNLTRDPEMRALPSGIQVTTFGVATNRVWKDKEGNKKEQADFHNIVVFGRQAETATQYLKKGQSVLVEGRMQTRSWDDKTSGEKKYRTEIVADRVQFGPRSSGASAGGASKGPKGTATEGVDGGKAPDAIEYPQEEINPEDIPF